MRVALCGGGGDVCHIGFPLNVEQRSFACGCVCVPEFRVRGESECLFNMPLDMCMHGWGSLDVVFVEENGARRWVEVSVGVGGFE